MPLRRLLTLPILLVAAACARTAATAPAPEVSGTAPRALAVYRTVAESIYVRTTGRVVAVATASLDSACAAPTCIPLAARWGMESLWFATTDSAEAEGARADLLARAATRLDLRPAVAGRSLLFEADAGDVPPDGAETPEWVRFRQRHADASGVLLLSPVGFSPSGRTAVLFVDWRCGPTCGHRLGVSLTAAGDTSWTIGEMLLIGSTQQPVTVDR